jgi:hypothetical protein
VKHLLITYIDPSTNNNHVDPDFKNLAYGDSGDRGYILINNLELGSYVFFNTKIGNQRYITGYFCVDKILFRGKDDKEISQFNSDAESDEIIIVGDKSKSKVLTSPLLFDKDLVMKLPSLKADWKYFEEKSKNNISELSAITSKTRTHRKLKEYDKDLLLSLCEHRG